MSGKRRAMPKHLRYVIAERDGTDCALCGKTIRDIERATLDHIVPRAHGGRDGLENLQLAHYQCNAKRHPPLTREARMALREEGATGSRARIAFGGAA